MGGIDHPLEPYLMRLVNRAVREARAILGPGDGLAQVLLERYVAEVPDSLGEYAQAWNETRIEPVFGISLPTWELAAERLQASYVALVLTERVRAAEIAIAREETDTRRAMPGAWEVTL